MNGVGIVLVVVGRQRGGGILRAAGARELKMGGMGGREEGRGGRMRGAGKGIGGGGRASG